MYITAIYETHNVGGYDPDDSWSRDSTDGRVLGAKVIEHKDYDAVAYTGDGPVYAVIVGYTTGNTFGHDFRAVVVDVFGDKTDAEDLADTIRRLYGNYNHSKTYTFEHKGKEYDADWVGYFESLQSVGSYLVDTDKVWRF